MLKDADKLLTAYRDGYKDGYTKGYFKGRLKAFKILKDIIDEKTFDAVKALDTVDEAKIEGDVNHD
jgi:hypothetical protein